jgi:hypothetical protein
MRGAPWRDDCRSRPSPFANVWSPMRSTTTTTRERKRSSAGRGSAERPIAQLSPKRSSVPRRSEDQSDRAAATAGTLETVAKAAALSRSNHPVLTAELDPAASVADFARARTLEVERVRVGLAVWKGRYLKRAVGGQHRTCAEEWSVRQDAGSHGALGGSGRHASLRECWAAATSRFQDHPCGSW